MIHIRFGHRTFNIDRQLLCQTSRVVADSATKSFFRVQSHVSPSVFESFLTAIKSKTLAITNETLESLSQLCQEFDCPALLQQISDFQNLDSYKIFALTQQIMMLKAENLILCQQISQNPSKTRRNLGSSLCHQIITPSTRSSCEVYQSKAWSNMLDSQILFDNPMIIINFAEIFHEFRLRHFTLLWRGSKDGFLAQDFHSHCDGHVNTITLIQDVDKNIFGGYTPVEWESRTRNSFCDESNCWKADLSCKSFLFALRTSRDHYPKKFPLISKQSTQAILCDRSHGPCFHGLEIVDRCNNTSSNNISKYSSSYSNDDLNGGSLLLLDNPDFIVMEIEVFEITD
jgi:hypothetical protein